MSDDNKNPMHPSEVWVRIAVAVASCTNSGTETTLKWADRFTEEYKKRFCKEEAPT